MTRIILAHDDDTPMLNDVDAILSALRFQLNWAAEVASIDPEQFEGREAELSSLLTVHQLIASRFISLPTPANDTTGLDAQLGLVARAMRSLPDGAQ